MTAYDVHDVDEVNEDWADSLADLHRRREASRAMGGEERLARHRAAGKLDARARMAHLLDPGSFREIGTLVGGDVPSDAFVAGTGTVDGRHVMAGCEDFTVLAGTSAAGTHAKRNRLAELALQERVPLVMVLEGAGGRPTATHGVGRQPVDLSLQALCSGKVPIVTAVCGAAAGHAALIAPMSDFRVMTDQSCVFTAGPPVVKASTGEDVTKEVLGGPAVAVGSGLIHNVAPDDGAAIDMVRHYLSYFPSSAWSYPPRRDDGGDQGPRPTPELLDIVPRNNRRVYDMRKVLDVVFDDGDWFEIQPGSGKAIICALAHLGGEVVAVVANQPIVLAGSIDADAADKAAHFIGVADAFHVPLVFLSDNPGVLPGTQSERAGILRAGARMFAAQTFATTPKMTVTLRKAYGFGSMVMSGAPYEHQTATFNFPGATTGVMGASSAGSAMKSDEEELAQLREMELRSSYNSATALSVDEMLDPRETRNALLATLGLALTRRQKAAKPRRYSAVMP
jgi:acetyl-CoA carboxylase carboxyltransferase component